MTDPTSVVLAALGEIPELRPAAPIAAAMASWVSWDLDRTAVDVDDQRVTVRLVAHALPLPPVLDRAETLLRQAIRETGLHVTELRLVVVDIDAAAFG